MKDIISVLYVLILILVVGSSLISLLLILFQADKGGGLGSMFGGAGGTGSQSILGSRRTDILQKLTYTFLGIFILGSFFLAYLTKLEKQEVEYNPEDAYKIEDVGEPADTGDGSEQTIPIDDDQAAKDMVQELINDDEADTADAPAEQPAPEADTADAPAEQPAPEADTADAPAEQPAPEADTANATQTETAIEENADQPTEAPQPTQDNQ